MRCREYGSEVREMNGRLNMDATRLREAHRPSVTRRDATRRDARSWGGGSFLQVQSASQELRH